MPRFSRLPVGSAKLGLLALALVGACDAQVFFDRQDIMVNAGWIDGKPVSEDITQRRTYEDPRWRARMLDQFPGADADGDGALSEVEAIRFHLARVRRFSVQGEELEMLPAGVRHWTERVPMRDGETLPAEVFLPPGEGPWPVVLIRTARGRIDSALDYGNELLRHGYAVVGGDLTPEGDFINADLLGQLEKTQPMTREERAAYNSRRGERNDGEDGADTIAWIARQSWCDGHIALNGYSEASEQSKQALAEKPLELDAVITEIGSITTPYRMALRAGAGFLDSSGRYPPLPTAWEAPTEPPPRVVGPFLEWEEEGDVPDVFFNDRSGWFDFPVQGMIEEWKRLAPGGKATLIMGVGGHGSGFMRARMPPNYGDCDLLFPEIRMFSVLKDDFAATGLPEGSHFFYFLMGDALDPAAPGNVWKVTDHWPVADRSVSFHLAPGGVLDSSEAPSLEASAEYRHDPRDPVKTAGGNRFPTGFHGPRDQRHLDGREDALLFLTPVLEEPLELTGEVEAHLYISTDAPDTAFFVQLLDVYPDGYEWLIRDGEAIARFHEEGDGSTPLEADQIYHLRIPMVATALVLAKGHRLGVRVMSSCFPATKVHPNTWESIDSYDQSRPAQQTLHFGGAHASRVILPIVSPGVSQDVRGEE